MDDGKTFDDILSLHEESSQKAIASFRRDLKAMRTGRANASVLEGIMVDYYGSKTALSHLGQISSPEPRVLTVQVYDSGAIESCEKAIQSSDLGFNPNRDGNTLRINVPTLTEEGRKEIVKHLNKVAEDIRVSLRNHRRDANDSVKKLEKANELTKDEAKKGLEKIQAQTDLHVKEVDTLLQAKEAECMEV